MKKPFIVFTLIATCFLILPFVAVKFLSDAPQVGADSKEQAAAEQSGKQPPDLAPAPAGPNLLSGYGAEDKQGDKQEAKKEEQAPSPAPEAMPRIESELARELKPLPPPRQLTDAEIKAAADKMVKAQQDLAESQKAAAAVEAALPRVKRIFSCEEQPAPEAIVEGLSQIQKYLPAAGCDDRCDFQPVETYILQETSRCSLRNSLALTPNQIKASYPDNLLRTYVDKLHELRQQYPDWKKFTDVTESLRSRLKEYLWVNRCAAAKIGIANSAFEDTVDACDKPYYTMVHSSRNLDGESYPGGHKFDSYYWQLLDLEEMKDGNFLIADYSDLRFMPPKVNFFILKRDDISLTPVMGDELNPFTGKIEQTSDFHGILAFDRETGKMAMGGMNVHVGTSWGAQYHLEGNRLILDEVRAGAGFGEPKIIYTPGHPVDPSALISPKSNIRTYEDSRHDPRVKEMYKEHLPPLTAAQKADYLAVLTGSDTERKVNKHE